MYKGSARRLLDEPGMGGGRIGAIDRQIIFYVLNDREAVRERQIIPGRHCRAAHATGDRSQQVAVGRDGVFGQPELELALG